MSETSSSAQALDSNPIQGVEIQPLKIISDERGAIFHMLRCDSPLYEQFGEVYFSEVKSGVIKGWKKHRVMTQHYAVPVGRIVVAIYDGRLDSPTKGTLQTVELGRACYQLLQIPPGVWYGFKGTSRKDALIVNCASHPHEAGESETLPLENPPYPGLRESLNRFSSLDGLDCLGEDAL